MTRRATREITVEGRQYFWVLDGNSITDQNRERHIKVHVAETTKRLLYIDPTPWHFKVTPKMVAEAIRYAISQGWEPGEAGKEMYISMKEDQFYVLPYDVKFAFEDRI